MQNACMHEAKLFLKHGKFRHFAYMYFEAAAANVYSRCQGNIRKRKSSRTSIDSITTASEVLIFVIF